MAWVEGKTVLITGATGGIGRAAAFALASHGAQLVLLCRDAEKGAATRREIAHETGKSRRKARGPWNDADPLSAILNTSLRCAVP